MNTPIEISSETHPLVSGTQTKGGLRSWFMALRPKTLTAALAPVMVATALVKAESFEVPWWVSIFALLSAMFIQIGTNFFNDALDFKKGADTEKRVGPQRVTQSGLLSHKQVMFGGGVCFFIAFLLGVPLVLEGGWPIVFIGLISLLLGYAYTGGPFPLAYRGLGDLFVILFFGLVAVLGTFYIHTHTVSSSAVVAGFQVGFLATVLIAVNNLRDASQDVLVNKKTLAVRFGTKFARAEITVLALAPFLFGTYWMSRGFDWAALLPIATVPLARRLVQGIWTQEPGPVYNKFLALGAALQVLFCLLFSIGLWLR